MTSSEFEPNKHLTPTQLVERWKGTPFPVSLVTLARWRRVKRGPVFIRAGHSNTRVFYPITDLELYEQPLTPLS